MKIIVKNNNSERQSPEVTIDTSTCHYTYAIREALWLALELDGYDMRTIKEVFGMSEDGPVQTEPESGQPYIEQSHFTFDEKGYTEAVFYLLDNGKYKEATDGYANLSYARVINAADELWKQNNPTN